MRKCTAVPANEQELLAICQQIAGKTLAELASTYNQTIPKTLLHAKGFVGQLIERGLGVLPNNLAEPDFVNLGIELKTLPINEKGAPQESTYICTAPTPLESEQESFETSRVWQKLKRILFVPIEAAKTIPIQERSVGQAFLWSPDLETKSILKQDWEELTEMLMLGHFATLSARLGTYLQIRPKAMHSRDYQMTCNDAGEPSLMVPKGFYLRPLLTKKIINATAIY